MRIPGVSSRLSKLEKIEKNHKNLNFSKKVEKSLHKIEAFHLRVKLEKDLVSSFGGVVI